MPEDSEDLSFSDRKAELVHCCEISKFLGQVVESDRVLRVVCLSILLLLVFMNLEFLLSLGPLVKAETDRFLDSVSVWHDLIEPNVDTEPNRNGEYESTPCHSCGYPTKVHTLKWELAHQRFICHELGDDAGHGELRKQKEQVNHILARTLDRRKLEKDDYWQEYNNLSNVVCHLRI